MKNRFFWLCFILLSAFPAGVSALMAPIYPDATPAPHEVNKNVKDYIKVFYSRDPIEKVKKFYDSQIGKMQELKSRTGYKKILKKVDRGYYDTYEPSELGVIINTNIKKTTTDKSSLYRHEYFRYLETQAAHLDGKDRKDYEAVCKRFESLAFSYFMPTDKKDSQGRVLNKAQEMIAGFKEKNPGFMEASQSLEQMSKKIQELMQQNKMDEAVALSRQMGQDALGAQKQDESLWDDYVKLLENLEKNHAYKTRIAIHTGK